MNFPVKREDLEGGRDKRVRSSFLTKLKNEDLTP